MAATAVRVGSVQSVEQRRAAWRESLRSLLSDLPEGFEGAREAAAELRLAFHEELAVAMRPKLTALVDSLPAATYVEKQSMAHRVNHELHALGLAIQCPKTQKAASLLVDIRDSQSQASRFRLEVEGDRGKSVKTFTSSTLPGLELMPEPPRREGGSRWKGPSK